jgi:hypothetical protein
VCHLYGINEREAEERGFLPDSPVVGTWDTAGGSMSTGVIFELVLTQESLCTKKDTLFIQQAASELCDEEQTRVPKKPVPIRCCAMERA